MKDSPPLKKWIYASIASISLWICVAWISTSTNQPTDFAYDGKFVSTWLQELVPANPPETRVRATAAVRVIGTNGLPLFLEYLSQRDNSLKEIWSRYWERLRRRPPSLEPIFRRNLAVAGFRALGPLGRPAIPKLKSLMMHRELAYDAARALGALQDQETIDLFVHYLYRPEPEMRAAGLAGLGSMGVAARSIVPKIVNLITKDKDASVRANAADALGAIGPSDRVIPILVDRLDNDEDITVRFCAVYALANFPQKADELEAILQKAEHDGSQRVRDGAHLAERKLRDAVAAGKLESDQ